MSEQISTIAIVLFPCSKNGIFSVSFFPSAKLKVDCLRLVGLSFSGVSKERQQNRSVFSGHFSWLYLLAKTESWFIEGCLHFRNNVNYRFVVLNRTNVWCVNLQQWCQCGVCVFNHLLYILVYSFTLFILSCAHSVFLRGVFSFENDKRAHFLSCRRTPGYNRRWRHRRWPQFSSVN